MITRLEATRYRCFDRLDVDIGEFRVLVGANGSGKTMLLDIPVLLGDMLETRTLGDAFLRERGHRAPRASSFRELIFQGIGDSFIPRSRPSFPSRPHANSPIPSKPRRTFATRYSFGSWAKPS